MIALDTNILVFALHPRAPQHGEALRRVQGLATGSAPWALPYPCIAEFLRVVTHRLFRPALPPAVAWHDLRTLLASPSARLLTPTDRHQALLREVMDESGATGDLVLDAQIATLCLEYGVREILTADKDFRRFTGLKVTDPFA
jgi:toxin-antitoxin system PIN domain toxin